MPRSPAPVPVPASPPAPGPDAVPAALRALRLRCPACRYDLREVESDRCPECGRRIEIVARTTSYLDCATWWIPLLACIWPLAFGLDLGLGPRFDDIVASGDPIAFIDLAGLYVGPAIVLGLIIALRHRVPAWSRTVRIGVAIALVAAPYAVQFIFLRFLLLF